MPASPAVLLVDDDPTAQLIALSMLRHLGIEADAASDGAEGVRMAAARAYDVILMDVQMPVMDGAEAVRVIRATPGGDRPRIVAVTERAVGGEAQWMAHAGFDGGASKPFSIPVLQEAVWPAAEAAPPPAAPPAASGVPDALLRDVRAHVHDLLGEDDEAFVADLVEAFAASARKALATLRSVRQARDLGALVTVVHSIKGSAANIGLTSLAETWNVVETGARNGDEAMFDAVLTEAVTQTAEAVGGVLAPTA